MSESKLTGHKIWLILDGRAWEDPDGAAVYCAYSSHPEPADRIGDMKVKPYKGDTLALVKKERDEMWPDGVIYEYDEEKREDAMYMVNQKLIG